MLKTITSFYINKYQQLLFGIKSEFADLFVNFRQLRFLQS